MSGIQQTLTGNLTDADRDRPATFVTCPECGDPVLRSRLADHPHPITPPWASPGIRHPDGGNRSVDDEYDEDDGEPERVGGWYDVTISVSVDYRFRIPAWSDHEAKDIADDWRFDATPADSHVVHTDTREVGEITTEDVPDDFDPYGGDLLHEVFDDE